jgi:hypothetical protein
MNGQYDTAATIAQSMAQYNPQLSAQMLATLPNGLNYYATADAKERAGTAQQYKQANMGLQNKYTLGQIVTRGKIEDNQLKERLKFDKYKTDKEIAERARESDNNNSVKIALAKSSRSSPSGGGSGSGGGEKIDKTDRQAMNMATDLYERAIKPTEDGTLDHDAVDNLTKWVNDNSGRYDDDTRTMLNAMAYVAQGLMLEKEGATGDYIYEHAFQYVPKYLLEQLLPDRNFDGY